MITSKEPLTLYIKSGCPWCEEAIEFLESHRYKFNPIDVSSDPAAMEEMIEISGQHSAPTLVVGEKVLPDFDVEQLEEFFLKNGIKP
jgi:glutaredoxin 3